jgi:hypothetical protein
MTATETYAAAVVAVLREHVPNVLTDPVAEAVVTRAVEQQARDRRDSFECIVDDPGSARWRLKGAAGDRSRVRLHYCPVVQPGAARWHELERTVNDALRALEDTP